MNNFKNQLFFSHSWKNDNLGRNNHFRVYKIAKILQNLGYSIWIDEDNMIGDIDYCMCDGIENSQLIIVCLTESYFKKIDETAKNPYKRDNCYKEWTYSNARQKMMIPVIMEPSLKNISLWPPSIISLYFASQLYIDCSYDNLQYNTNNILKYLKKINVLPEKKVFNTNIIDKKMINKTNYGLVNKFVVNLMLNMKIKQKNNIKKLTSPKKLKHALYKPRWGSTGQLCDISI